MRRVESLLGSRKSVLAVAGVFALACSFPEHDFIPADEFAKLKNDASAGFGGGGIGGVAGSAGFGGGTGGLAGGGSGGLAGSGGTGATGGSAGTSGTGGSAGTSGTGGTAGTSGAGGSGGAPSCAGKCGNTGPVPGSNPPCYCDSSCTGFANCCSDYATVCGTGGTGGTGGGTGGTGGGTGGTGGTGGATGGTGGATGGTGGTGGGTGGSGGTGGGTTCAVLVVNEVSTSTSGSGSDEFVEIFNKGTCAANLAGWTLKYSSKTASNPATRWTGGATDQLSAGGYFVIGGSSYTGATQGTLSSGIADEGGVGLYNGGDLLIDAVAWGAVSAGHPYVEGTAFGSGPLSSGQSAARSPNGADTNDNSKDFKLVARTPGASN